MNIPLSIVEAGKTDEYVRLQKRLDHFTEKKCSAVEEVMRASQKLFSLYPSERKGFYPGVKIPTGLVIEMQNAVKETLAANRELEHIEAILSVVKNDIKRLEEGGA